MAKEKLGVDSKGEGLSKNKEANQLPLDRKWNIPANNKALLGVLQKPMELNVNPEYDLNLIQGATRDTISVVERPTVDSQKKEIHFGSTLAGAQYKIYKQNTADRSKEEIASFIGDGNPVHISFKDEGLYSVSVQKKGSYEEGNQINIEERPEQIWVHSEAKPGLSAGQNMKL